MNKPITHALPANGSTAEELTININKNIDIQNDNGYKCVDIIHIGDFFGKVNVILLFSLTEEK